MNQQATSNDSDKRGAPMPRVVISAAHKSSGKTTLTLGLCAALHARGHEVQPFKKGPDYIDPLWLGMAAQRPCYNLDFHMMQRSEIERQFARAAAGAHISLIEGNKGLYDGLDLDGSNSNAALAKLLGAPVVLVIDARGMTRGVAPLILGYQAFDPDIRIAGVILNNLGGSRHESKLRAVIEQYTDVEVIGAVQHDASMQIAERHLGLVPANEQQAARARIQHVAARVAAQVDLDTLHADTLPDVDGLIIGGGFPEVFMAELEANVSLRSRIRRAIEAGLPTYAECGGLMYLSRRLDWQGKRCEMAGVVPGDTVMHDRPVGRGYARLQPTGDDRWQEPAPIPAHEFHNSSLENLPADSIYAYQIKRGHGIDGVHDGYQQYNLLAAYVHRRGSGERGWIAPCLNQVRAHKARAAA